MIDRDQLDQLLRVGAEGTVREIVAELRDLAAGRSAELESDVATLVDRIHRISGLAAMVGAREIKRFGDETQRRYREGDLTDLSGLRSEYYRILQRTADELEEALDAG